MLGPAVRLEDMDGDDESDGLLRDTETSLGLARGDREDEGRDGDACWGRDEETAGKESWTA